MVILNQADRYRCQQECQTVSLLLVWDLSVLEQAVNTSLGSAQVFSGSHAEPRRGNGRSGVYAGERKQAWTSSQLIRRSLPVLHEIIMIHPLSTAMSSDLGGRPFHSTHQVALPASEP